MPFIHRGAGKVECYPLPIFSYICCIHAHIPEDKKGEAIIALSIEYRVAQNLDNKLSNQGHKKNQDGPVPEFVTGVLCDPVVSVLFLTHGGTGTNHPL